MWYKHLHDLEPAEWAEYGRVIAAELPGIVQEALKKGWPAEALSNVMEYFDKTVRDEYGLRAVIINGEYLFIYAVGYSWWHTKPYMVEEFLLALQPNGNLRACLDMVEVLAKEEGCSAVCIGTAAAPSNDAYARLLNRYGYKTLAYQLIKEV